MSIILRENEHGQKEKVYYPFSMSINPLTLEGEVFYLVLNMVTLEAAFYFLDINASKCIYHQSPTVMGKHGEKLLQSSKKNDRVLFEVEIDREIKTAEWFASDAKKIANYMKELSVSAPARQDGESAAA